MVEPPSLVAASPSPPPTSSTASDVNTLTIASLLHSSLQTIKVYPLTDLAVRVATDRDYATTLRDVSYDK
ncbi:hypothetical protein AMTR_s00145p00024690 [Amborella trichopoda]|uniref:Uncharacterized protein n=1 Tax=Amborella trichopoda TaxID=13333 RepID=W1PDY9_AMBTC|nr:hypothetical protein AMTR_s00145p00024690 [Amborella trichopoda]